MLANRVNLSETNIVQSPYNSKGFTMKLVIGIAVCLAFAYLLIGVGFVIWARHDETKRGGNLSLQGILKMLVGWLPLGWIPIAWAKATIDKKLGLT